MANLEHNFCSSPGLLFSKQSQYLSNRNSITRWQITGSRDRDQGNYNSDGVAPKLEKSPDRNHNLISSGGGQDTAA